MKKPFIDFIKCSSSSRIEHLLLVVHLIVAVLTFAELSPVPREQINSADPHTLQTTSTLLAGRSLHFRYDPLALQILTFIDIPGILLSIIIGLPLIPISLLLPPYEDSWLSAFILLCGTSIQWLVIGYWTQQFLRHKETYK